MNLFEYLALVITGPLFMPARYDRFLWLANYFVLSSLPLQLHILPIALGLGALSAFLNLYQAHTETLIANGAFSELDDKTAAIIDAIAQREHITIATKAVVTNFTVPVIITGRFKNNTEIYISHHWLESEGSRKHLAAILEGQLACASQNHNLKGVLLPSLLYAINLLTLLAIRPIVLTAVPYGLYVLFLLNFINNIIIQYISAEHYRYMTYQQDKSAAYHTTPHDIQEALRFFESKSNYDTNTAHIPEWKLPLPKNSSRIERLKKLEPLQQNPS